MWTNSSTVTLFSKLVFLSGLIYVLWGRVAEEISFQSLLEGAEELNAETILFATISMALSIIASCWRFRSILEGLGLPIPKIDAYRANILGIVGGMVFFQLAGQTITRASMLRRFGVTPSQVLFANSYERLLAAGWLLSSAILSAIWLFPTISIDLFGDIALVVKLLVSLLLCFCATWYFVWRGIFVRGFVNLNYVDLR